MATTTTETGVNEFESKIGSITVHSKAHSLSVWFVLALRLMMGYAFLYAGVVKVMEGGILTNAWTAQGYLVHAAGTNGNPLEGLFVWMGTTPWFVAFVDVAIPWGELFIGLGLLVGFMTRLAAFWGAFMMLMFYFGNWSVEHGVINGDFAYMLVFLAVAAFGAGRVIGLDALVEKYQVGGMALIERYPALRYVLG